VVVYEIVFIHSQGAGEDDAYPTSEELSAAQENL
jgi:hypothetical protein